MTHRTALAWVALLAAPAIGAQQPRDAKAAVAALDKQYQAAVKANDTATMNRMVDGETKSGADGSHGHQDGHRPRDVRRRYRAIDAPWRPD